MRYFIGDSTVIGAPADTVTTLVSTAFGGSDNVGGIFLSSVGVTDDGTGHCSSWRDARGGASLITFAAGQRPTIEAGTGYLVFAGSEYGSYGAALITGVDNWAIMTGRQALEDRAYERTMIAAVGTGGTANGFGITSNTPSNEFKGGVLNGLSWVDSNHRVTYEPYSADAVHSSMHDQTFRRLAGTTTNRHRGFVLGGSTSAATPGAPGAVTYIGWNGNAADNKFKGKIGYVVFVANDPGGTAMVDAETALFGAYGIKRFFTSIALPAAGAWSTMAELNLSNPADIAPFTLASASEGAAPVIVTAPSPMSVAAVKIDYTAATGSVPYDRNAGVDLTLPTPVDRSKFIRISMSMMWDAAAPLATNGTQRKLLYPQQASTGNANANFFSIMNSFTAVLETFEQAGYINGAIPAQNIPGPNLGISYQFAVSTVYNFVLTMRFESALGMADGYVELTINGTLVHRTHNAQFSHADWIGVIDPTLQKWNNIRFGCQLDTFTTMQEYRYISAAKVETAAVP